MTEFEKAYPADPRALVAMRLRRFLDLTKDIDFTAKLVERDKKMRFADPALEAKPARLENVLPRRQGRPPTPPGLSPRNGSRTSRPRV